MKIIILKSKRNKQWYFRIVASNGKKVAHSEGYRNKSDCVKTANLLMANLSTAKIENK